ncbi:hydrolase [Flavobacteriales bacterium 33_180_T64]|nr:hydrolase [Flavobacteriales bacterium 33_180_T64]
MYDELIDILTPKGKPTGKSALKSEIHSKGYYHNTAHLWFYTSEGYILLQQRAASKIIYPLLWDVSVAGHVDAGESIEQAAIRETKEEINLDISEAQLIKIGVFECFQSYPNDIIDNEFHNTFLCELKTDLKNLTPQLEEVEALKLVTLKEFETLLKHSKTNNHFVSSNSDYYKFIAKTIKTKISK